MRRLNRHLQEISGFGWRVAFAGLEYFDVAALHLLAVHFDGAEGHDDALSTRWRGRRARRAIFEHSNVIIFEQRTRLTA